ncbi:hypothetical protein BVRB_3g065710 [Beta vulgaris subsp. vulgaris]|uniref:CCHC-type domain-containing protein n=1 Tax=Beta vulgaris subsp. vulgaris TaxID=3555 RepID=A0A0J8CS96_BETVV|nr:hypothetical protein BVRB_3g065710 [Beta vulgaris subsp. vulgaris]
MEHSQSTSNFVVWHRKQGPVLKTPIEHFNNHPIDVSLVLVGKFLDQREFPVRHVQDWVDLWYTRGRIIVKKEGKLFFFHCREAQDRSDILGLYDTMNFRGALLVLKAWKPLDSFKSFNFSESAIWVKIEGIPLVISSKSLANLIFSRVGKTLYFDVASGQPGIKKHFRALVWIKIKGPLLPGMYLEMQEGRTIWVDLRYEGVYVFCKRCGRVGHKSSSCSITWEKAKAAIEKAISEACIPETPVMLGSSNASLYSNKIIGLPHSPEFMTTVVKLNEPRRPPSDVYSSSSSDNDDDKDDMHNSVDEEMRNVNSDPEQHQNGSGPEGGVNSGPTSRPPYGSSYQQWEEGGPSNWHEMEMNSQSQHLALSTVNKNKGKNVLSLKSPSFKRTKRKKCGSWMDKLKFLQNSVAINNQPPKSKTKSNQTPLHFLSHQLKPPATHITPINPFEKIKPHQIGSFLPLNYNSINRNTTSLSSFNSLSTTSSSRGKDTMMESNNSSPHSSNSITQPYPFTLTPQNPQNFDENILQNLTSAPVNENMGMLQQDALDSHVNAGDLNIPWENSTTPNSLSSYFNSEDALFGGAPLFEPFSISDPIDWNELQSFLQSQSFSLSPQTPLSLPGTHSSLQTGSSSSYHSAVAGIPANEFADLRIFPAWQNSYTVNMDGNGIDGSLLGKRKFDALSEVLEVAGKRQEPLVDVPVQTATMEVNTSKKLKSVEQGNSEIKPDVVGKSQTEPTKAGRSSQKGTKSAKIKSKNEVGRIAGKIVKGKASLFSEKLSSLQPVKVEPNSKSMGRPPKPKRKIVQALVCEKKRKFEEFEPLLEAFITEVTLDLHKWISEKRQEILHKFKKFKYMAIFGEESLETGPKQWPSLILVS